MSKCLSPVSFRKKGISYTGVCHKCIACKLRDTRNWAIRVDKEVKNTHGISAMILFTYSEDTVPRNEKGFEELRPKDMREFLVKAWKMQRQLNKVKKRHKADLVMGMPIEVQEYKTNFKYILAGEYGPETRRPHYHMLAIGLSYELLEKFEELWGKGYVSIKYPQGHAGGISGAIRYIVDYIGKNNSEEYTKKNGLQPEFRRFSMGMGKAYIEKHRSQIKRGKLHVVRMNNREYPMPKYMREKAFGKIEREVHNLKTLEKAEKREQEEIERLSRETGEDGEKVLQERREAMYAKALKKRFTKKNHEDR